jgi:hypothetical protein
MKVTDCLPIFTCALSLFVLGCGPDAGVIDPGSHAVAGEHDRDTVVVNSTARGNGIDTTIQGGIDRVADGGVVLVKPGTYKERITIRTGLTVAAIAEGSGQVILKDSQLTSAPAREAVILVDTPHPVVIRGLTVQHHNIRGVNILRDADVTIERTSFEGVSTASPIVGNGVTAVYNAGTSGKRARVIVRESRFSVGGIGIAFGGDVDGLIERNEIRQAVSRLLCVNVSPTGQGGTTLTSPGTETNVDIVNNLLEDCGENATGRFNSVVIAGTPGANTAGRVNVIGNLFRNTSPTKCPASGILYEHYSGVIERNSLVGIVRETCAAIDPVRNRPSAIFIGSRVTGIQPADVAVRFNDISSNAPAGLRIGSNQPHQIDATCNWWGGTSGPSGLGPGSGDAIVVEADGVAPDGVAPRFAPFATGPIAETSATNCSGG